MRSVIINILPVVGMCFIISRLLPAKLLDNRLMLRVLMQHRPFISHLELVKIKSRGNGAADQHKAFGGW